MQNNGAFVRRILWSPELASNTMVERMSVPLNWQNVSSEHLSTYLIINAPSVIIRASSLPFGITPQSQAFRVPENWGGMGPKSVRLLSLLFFLCCVWLGPGPGPLTSVKHVASHGLRDSSSLTLRSSHGSPGWGMLHRHSAARSLLGRAHKWKPCLYLERNPPKLLSLKHFISTLYPPILWGSSA